MSYSQNNEEEIILRYFGKYVGTFLDLGSYTGVELSNVRALAERGWSGLMVEASPTVFWKLKENYKDFPKVELHNMAVGSMTGLLNFFDNHNAVGTLYKRETERWGKKETFELIEVPCLEITEFLDLAEIKTFDFISIDIEGEDLNVLKRLDLKKLKTKLICVEWNSKDFPAYDNLVTKQGFKLIHKNAENLIYSV